MCLRIGTVPGRCIHHNEGGFPQCNVTFRENWCTVPDVHDVFQTGDDCIVLSHSHSLLKSFCVSVLRSNTAAETVLQISHDTERLDENESILQRSLHIQSADEFGILEIVAARRVSVS